jgi:hypothetical protein
MGTQRRIKTRPDEQRRVPSQLFSPNTTAGRPSNWPASEWVGVGRFLQWEHKMSLMNRTKIRVTFLEEALGTASANPDIHSEFVASKSPDAETVEEEVAAIGVDQFVEKSMTVFPRDENGCPILWDYQVKGFFKDACSMLRRVTGSKSSKITAHKKVIDGLVFVEPRKIVLNLPDGEEIGNCQRPLRAETAQGPRVALSNSESVPAGTTFEMEIVYMKPSAKAFRLDECITEWLEYGVARGIGQWRNSGKGRFEYEVID